MKCKKLESNRARHTRLNSAGIHDRVDHDLLGVGEIGILLLGSPQQHDHLERIGNDHDGN